MRRSFDESVGYLAVGGTTRSLLTRTMSETLSEIFFAGRMRAA